MKIIRPFAVTDATLVSCTVPETAPAAYAGGTTYALGDRVSVTTGTTSIVYQSLAGSNTGHTPASSPSWWENVGTTYSSYSAGTTYALDDIVIDPATHRTYQSLAGSNLGNSLTADPNTWWLDLGYTNRWKMFDQVNGSQTSSPTDFTVVVNTTGRMTGVALLNISASSVTISATADAVSVYDETFDLQSYDGIVDYYSYFFEDITTRSDLVVTDLPLYSDMQITVTVSGTDVLVGSMIFGSPKEIGDAVYGANVGIIDYSRKQVDDFGNYTVVERTWSKRMSLPVVVTGDSMPAIAAKVDALARLLASYRATPIVWIGADEYGSTAIFGFYKSFDIEIAYPTRSNLTLEIEGLT